MLCSPRESVDLYTISRANSARNGAALPASCPRFSNCHNGEYQQVCHLVGVLPARFPKEPVELSESADFQNAHSVCNAERLVSYSLVLQQHERLSAILGADLARPVRTHRMSGREALYRHHCCNVFPEYCRTAFLQ